MKVGYKMEEIDIFNFKQNWKLDPKGYFLIKINRDKKIIEVGHCLENNNVLKVFKGKNPEEIMYKIIDENIITLLDHAAYLGKELQKAYIALNHGFKYTQDSNLKKFNKDPSFLIISHRTNKISELLETPEKYGVEIDIRTHNNQLILNHEPYQDGDSLEEYLKHFKHKFIIFNIKEAGIEQEVINLAERYNITDYFLLDVEFPFIYHATRKQGFKKIAIRYSEAEPIEMALAQKGLIEWVWIDTNTKFPLNIEDYKKLKQVGFKLCLVCPERWGRPQDIQKYRDYMEENNMQVDAVMTSLKYIGEWEHPEI